MKLVSCITNLIYVKEYPRIVILGISILFINVSVLAQDTISLPSPNGSEVNHIRWVGKFPSGNKAESKSILNKIGEFFMGKKQLVNPSKPISIFAVNPDLYWVLDQSIGNILKVQDQVGEIPQFLKEKHHSLVGLCSIKNNEMLFTDSRDNKIYQINLDKEEITEFGQAIDLSQPTGIAYSQLNDEIWVVETAAHQISVFNPQGRLLRKIGKRGEGPGEFNFPTFIWIDNSGKVYIVDSMNFRVQILNDKGEVISYFGKIGDATGYFSRPKGIATDTYNNIYIVDALFHSVQIFDKNGNFLYNFGEQGRANGQFWMPSGIFIDENNYIYVADSYNARIQIFQLINGEINEPNED